MNKKKSVICTLIMIAFTVCVYAIILFNLKDNLIF